IRRWCVCRLWKTRLRGRRTMQDNLLADEKSMPFGVTLKRTFRFIKPQLPRFIAAFVLIILNVAFDVAMPMFISAATENLKSGAVWLDFIIWLAVGYIALGTVNQIVLYVLSMMLQKAGQSIVANIRMETYAHIQSLSHGQLDKMPVGSLVTRVASYTASLSDLFTEVLVKVIKNVLTIVGVYAMMLYLSWQLALVMLGFIVGVALISFGFGKIIGALFRKERQYISELNTYLNENLSGMKLIHIFNRQQYKELEFILKNENLRKARYKVVMAFGIYRPLITLISVLAIAVTFWLGVQFGLTSSMIVAFYLYLSRFFNPVQNLADQLNNLQKALTASERIFRLLDIQPEVRDLPDAVDINEFKGDIEFKDVWFAYSGEDWILKGVSFKVSAGETCAFVGATGAGKSTILSLIVRNYEIQKGQILIDGRDIREIKIKSLRRAVGQMLQDVFLFSGTVKSNLTLENSDFTDEQIDEACKYVNADGFISRLPEGINSELSERGENLSQGQRQLLSFARTVLHRPQILILDEATANIDTETEVLINQSLEKMRNIGTMLVCAHRLSTIKRADNIIVMQHGEIVESGTHEKLLENGGYYSKLYALQAERQ
ncbi:MAG: ABC transporter ATP-binding protein/permease, partial [Clostridia bacterium]|nr:ABC transporter ATP-binding protein/permease [Clostridia bacterium]